MGSLCTGSGAPHEEVKDETAKSGNENDNNDNVNESKTVKILFLGPGGSGKSTIFKQLKLKLTNSYEKVQNRQQEAQSIHAYIVDTMKHNLELIKHRSKDENNDSNNNNDNNDNGHSGPMSEEIESPYEVYFEDLSVEAQEAALYIHERVEQLDNPRFTGKDDEIVKHIKILWNEEKFRDVFKAEAKMKADHSIEYFMEHLERISDKDYIPTDKDILLQRRPTTGIIEEELPDPENANIKFKLVDVGGQKNERRKWIHQFENVNTLIFVASLMAYDEPMFEDASTNSLVDCLKLFEEQINAHWFEQTKFVLFFNKLDRFKEKILIEDGCTQLNEFFNGNKDDAKYDINELSNKYNDCSTETEKEEKLNANLNFIKEQFLKRNTSGKDIDVFYTCAYEGVLMTKVFNEVTSISRS